MSSATHANEFVADTMALVLRLEGRKLGSAAKSAFDLCESGQGAIALPAMVFAEILYLSEKQRIATNLAAIADYLQQHAGCKECPLSLAVIQAAARIDDVPDLHDRLIAGTALLLGQSLITNDPVIQASRWVRTIW